MMSVEGSNRRTAPKDEPPTTNPTHDNCLPVAVDAYHISIRSCTTSRAPCRSWGKHRCNGGARGHKSTIGMPPPSPHHPNINRLATKSITHQRAERHVRKESEALLFGAAVIFMKDMTSNGQKPKLHDSYAGIRRTTDQKMIGQGEQPKDGAGPLKALVVLTAARGFRFSRKKSPHAGAWNSVTLVFVQ